MFDAASGRLLRGGVEVALGGRAAHVLAALFRAGGAIVDKAELLEAAWPGLVVEESNLSVQIAALRKALGQRPEGGEWIGTVARRGYRLIGAVREAEPTVPAGSPRAGRPSIAVLPFKNLGGEPSQDYFADGITEDVIAALTRFRWFHVVGRSPSFAYRASGLDVKEIARQLGARYLVLGTVRRSSGKVRVSCELVEASAGHCLSADRYDFDLVDVFALQDRIARRVAGSIEPELLQRETGLIAAEGRTASSTAWDLVARGCWHFHHITAEHHAQARDLFREARRVEPGLVEAMIWLARVDAGLLAFHWTDDRAGTAQEGIAAALEALRIDEKNGYAHYAFAVMSLFNEDYDSAIRAGERAVELVPSFALGHLALGCGRLFSGDAAGATGPLAEGLELNEHDPHNFVWHNMLALALLFSGRVDAASAAAEKALKVRPHSRIAMATMAAVAASAGRAAEAAEWRAKVAGQPRPPGDPFYSLWRSNPGWARQMEPWLGAEP